MSPWYKLEFVVPIVKVPPSSVFAAFVLFEKRVSWKAKRGSSRVPEVCARVCQKGVASDEAILSKARPIKPERGLVRRSEVVWLTTAAGLC